jgi:hypothetical protein
MPWWLHSSASFVLMRFGFDRSNPVRRQFTQKAVG